MRERVLYAIFLGFLVLYTPYWLYLPAIFLGIIAFPLFWESVLLGAFIDYYYGPHTYAGTLFGFPFSLVAAMLVLAAIELKERLRFNA